jgi:hypothetical protein
LAESPWGRPLSAKRARGPVPLGDAHNPQPAARFPLRLRDTPETPRWSCEGFSFLRPQAFVVSTVPATRRCRWESGGYEPTCGRGCSPLSIRSPATLARPLANAPPPLQSSSETIHLFAVDAKARGLLRLRPDLRAASIPLPEATQTFTRASSTIDGPRSRYRAWASKWVGSVLVPRALAYFGARRISHRARPTSSRVSTCIDFGPIVGAIQTADRSAPTIVTKRSIMAERSPRSAGLSAANPPRSCSRTAPVVRAYHRLLLDECVVQLRQVAF